MTVPKLKCGTRASPLAMAQAHMVVDSLLKAHGWAQGDIEIIPMTTVGDRVLDRALAEIGGKAVWTKELEGGLYAGDIDFAVHSMKDVETIRPDDITIAAMLPRADARDRLIGANSIAELPPGASIGTSSPRRSAQLLALRPDLEIKLLRGNVATRLKRLAEGYVDATLLASAGLLRLGQENIGAPVPEDLMLPAPAQGAIGIEVLTKDTQTRTLIDAISDPLTYEAVMIERALLEGLAGTCRSPVGALAQKQPDGQWHLRAQILRSDGAEIISDEMIAPAASARSKARDLGRAMLERASPALRALFEA